MCRTARTASAGPGDVCRPRGPFGASVVQLALDYKIAMQARMVVSLRIARGTHPRKVDLSNRESLSHRGAAQAASEYKKQRDRGLAAASLYLTPNAGGQPRGGIAACEFPLPVLTGRGTG